MKKILSFLILGVSALQFLACSSDSGNGASPENPANQAASSCALANAYLPAHSAISYESVFGGGCQANAQISVDQATEYSNLFVANGFGLEQNVLTPEVFIYKKNVSIDSTVIATLSYSQGSLVISAQEVAREYEFGDLSLIAENFVYEGLCIESWGLGRGASAFIYCRCNEIDQTLITNFGWILYEPKSGKEKDYYYQYNEYHYNLYRSLGTCSLKPVI